jgi:hypothetical protein
MAIGARDDGNGLDLAAVRDALRSELRARGLDVASDSHGLKLDLYVMGDGDLALALFEFKSSVHEACDTMYQGSWTAGLPPRFAVLPSSEAQAPELELLEQMRVGVVFFEVEGEGVGFPELEAVLTEHLGG